ncbi:hypothetical protein MRB53_027664 [Persea americana]|uniref:Uncharacterized protein n=1 Tax=Persea americana TaxID=3435 RepID=A0ACC2LLR9_PERAE|nr:hypothetical protein MRB53_027664 [Persea americana]
MDCSSGVFRAPPLSDLHECYIFNPWTRPDQRACYSLETNQLEIKFSVVVHEIEVFTYRFEVYSSKKKKRRQLLESVFESPLLQQHEVDDSGVYCNGVLYWQCMYNRALMFNVETKTPGHLAMPSDDDGELAFNYKWRSRVTVCHGQLHCIRINSTGRRLSIWKMLSMTSDGWLVLHNVDLAGAAERNLDILN